MWGLMSYMLIVDSRQIVCIPYCPSCCMHTCNTSCTLHV